MPWCGCGHFGVDLLNCRLLSFLWGGEWTIPEELVDSVAVVTRCNETEYLYFYRTMTTS